MLGTMMTVFVTLSCDVRYNDDSICNVRYNDDSICNLVM